MKFDFVDKVLSAAKDWHIASCLFVFLIGSVLQWFHRLDPTFVMFAGTVLGAITGHAFSPAQSAPDPAPAAGSDQPKG